MNTAVRRLFTSVICLLVIVIQTTPQALAAITTNPCNSSAQTQGTTTTITNNCGGMSPAQKEIFGLDIGTFDVTPGCGGPASTTTSAGGPLLKTYTDASRNNREVGATIYLPKDTQPHPLVIFAPGQKQDSSSLFYSRYLQAVADAGYIVAGADFSDNTSAAAIPNEAADIKFLIGQVQQDKDVSDQISTTSPVGLIGHSDGGIAALIAGYGAGNGQQDDRIGAVIEQDGALYPGEQYRAGTALLIMHGTKDNIEPISSASAVFSSIKTPYTAFAAFNGADHNSYISGQPSAQNNQSYAQFNGAVDTITKSFLDRELNGNKTNGTSLSKIVAGQYSTQVTLKESGDENKTAGPLANATTAAATTAASSCCASAGDLSGGSLPASVPKPYNKIFTDAAAATGADPLIIAAIFLSEHGYSFPDPPVPYGHGAAWATSIINGQPGAEGPFQFLPTTWVGVSNGGNIQDLKDAAAGAGRFIVSLGGKAGIPVGTLATANTQRPSVASVLGSYNAGPASDFNNGQTITYITDGLIAYNAMKSGTDPVAAVAGKSGSSVQSPGGVATLVVATTAAPAGCASSGAVAGSIIKTAEGYAWPTATGHSAQDSATPAYKKDWDGRSNMTDCAAFVGTVMIKSGVDTNFPPSVVGDQMKYVEAHPELYQIIQHPTSTTQLKPGDLLIHVDGSAQHSMIYIGDTTGNPKWQGADASWAPDNDNVDGHTPQISPNVTWIFAYPSLIAARYIGGGSGVTQSL